MDMWKWVETLQENLAEAGQVHSAELIDRLSSEICDLNIAQSEALLPEALALAQTLQNPWLEVYVGHWEMRHRLGNKSEGETALPAVIKLFERAHRKDTENCPQSICVTQDLSACYANIDGPGYAAERIEVCDETLARITPAWTCFCCLSDERVEALIDTGRAEEALAFIEQQEAKLEAIGKSKTLISRSRLVILQALNRHEEALEIIAAEEAEEKENGYSWANQTMRRNFRKAKSLFALDRFSEAEEILPALADVIQGDTWSYLQAAQAFLAKNTDANNWNLGRRLQSALTHYSKHGAHRIVVNMGAICARLALLRGAKFSAERALKLAQLHLPKLRADCGAKAQLSALQAEIMAAPTQNASPIFATVSADKLLEFLNAEAEKNEDRNPETEVECLLKALDELPNDNALREQASSALEACGAFDEAAQLLWDYLEKHTEKEEKLSYVLMGLLLSQADFKGLTRLADLYQKNVPITAHWVLANAAKAQNNWTEVERQCNKLLALFPDLLRAKGLLAHSLMQQQRFLEAAHVSFAIYEADPEQDLALWEATTAASAACDWALVRKYAAIFDMELESTEGEINEDWGWIIIRVFEDGETLDYYARRTGPVTARIYENAFSRFSQRVNDLIVYDVRYVHAPPEDEKERENFIPTFNLVHTIKKAGFGTSWLVDGIYPSDEEMSALREEADQRGFSLWTHSNSEYEVDDKEAGKTQQGIYFTIAAPETVAPLEVLKFLKSATKDWKNPLCWLALARECKSDEAEHQALFERFGW